MNSAPVGLSILRLSRCLTLFGQTHDSQISCGA
jgi:hypothetical protein